MKKISKACFVIAIIVLSLSVILTIASLCNLRVSYTRSYGNYRYYYYSSEVSPTKKLQLTIIGCTGIISGIMLFIISRMDSCETCDCEPEKPQLDIPEYTGTTQKAETKFEAPSYTGTTTAEVKEEVQVEEPKVVNEETKEETQE